VAKNRALDEDAWSEALLQDLAAQADLIERRPLRSIYFGGGTPSLMPLAVAERVLEAARSAFGLHDDAELTVEANPDDLGRFSDLRKIGFNRLSLGVQSVRDDHLSFLKRNHDAGLARRALEKAQAVFPSVSADLIYALPDQNARDWEKELAEVMAFGVQHLSLYQLTIEPGTPFGLAAERGRLVPSPTDTQADLYALTSQLTKEAGLPAYEVSNHASPGQEAVHNGLYWRGADWLAIGPGAHGRVSLPEGRLAIEAAARPKDYPSVPPGQRVSHTRLSREEELLETLAAGLRPLAGLRLERLGKAAPAVMAAAEPMIASGHLRLDGERLQSTEEGRLLLDYLTSRLAEAIPSERL
jgi:oxygen-independent coproporphyrinogen-3 oxidase